MRWPRTGATATRAAAAALAALLASAGATPPSAPEPTVKAAFLGKFPAYVVWPLDDPAQPITLCIVGHDSLGSLVDDATAGVTVTGRSIAVRRMARVDATSGCRIAYLAGSAAQSVGAALVALAGAAVLTVTDAEVGPTQGMIHFEVADRRVRFRIDQTQATAAKLVISSKLLALALSVRTKGGA